MTPAKISLLTFLFSCSIAAHAKKDTLSVEEAFNKKKITLELSGVGGYQGEVVNMKAKNLSGDTVVIFVEAGRRLDNTDSTQQDILVVKDDYIPLAKGQEKKSLITGFCCQAGKGAPAAKVKFLVGALAEDKLYDIARFLFTNKFPNHITQNAIWCISDDHDISSVEDDGTEKNAELRKYLAKLKNTNVPWYSTYYKKTPGQVFSGLPQRVTGTVDYYISDISQVVINVRDENGTIVKNFPAGNSVPRGWHLFNMDWNVLGLQNGKYYLRIYQNGRQLKEVQIDLK
jgi:hypothetical protein